MLNSKLNAQLWCLVLGGCLLLVAHTKADGCTITLPTDMPASEPVLLTSLDGSAPYTLFKPTGQTTTLAVGAKLLLVCAGSGNIIKAINQNSLELFCSAGNAFKTAANVQYTLKQLGCKSIPTSVLQLTAQRCAQDQGYIYEAGFTFNTNEFASVFSICYDNVTENTFYTHNIINGAAINFNIQESTRRAFRAEGMKFTTTATNTFYTINNQIARFETYFGTSQPYISQKMYMARGHLSPDADFIFGYEQLATYFYTNVAPEFQAVNAGNWIRVENLARNLAKAYGDDLEIYNGYIGTLQLASPSTPSQLVSIYLDDTQQIEAPEYYFKVIKHEPTNAAVVMITLNNPFAEVYDVDEFCTNVCIRAGIYAEIFDDMTRGYTFCCELSDFKNHYADLPIELNASSLLTQDPPTVVEEKDAEDEEEDEEEEATNTNGCSITMPTDIPNPEPVYLVSSAADPTPQLFWPKGQVTNLPSGSTFTVYCAGSGNTLVDVNQQTLQLTCQSDGSFYSAEKSQVYTLNQLKCSKIPTSDLQRTSTQCSDNQGYSFDAGFTLETGGFVTVFTICYDNSTENTLYARNIINGATQKYKINQSTRRAFRAEGMRFTTTATNTFYTINNQIARFEAYFGANQDYIDSVKFLARGHMSPDADFIFAYEQLATYFYVNTAPEFQIINAGNWIRVENLARKLAIDFGSDLLTFTSTLGLLQLPSGGNTLQPIYLDDGEFIEAPMWYYKVLIHPELPTDLVMITLNNPYADSADVVEFCTNVCDLYGLNSPFFTTIASGYTFCCTLEDFENSVTGLPTFDLPAGW